MTDDAEQRREPERSPTEREQRAWHHFMWRGLIGVIIIGVLFAGAWYFTREDHAPAAQKAAASPHAILVRAMKVLPRDVPIVAEFLDQTEASETITIPAPVIGFLIKRIIEDGDWGEQAQVLFRINPEPYEVALRRAEAGLKAPQAQLLKAKQ